MKAIREKTQIKLDEKGGLYIPIRNKDVKAVTPKGFFVVNLGDKLLLLFTEDKKTGFDEAKFDSVIILTKEKAKGVSELIAEYIEMKPEEKFKIEKPMNSEKQK